MKLDGSIKKILNIIKENNRLLARKYKEFGVGLSWDPEDEFDEERIWLMVETNYRRLPNKVRTEEIKEVFNADDVLFVAMTEDSPAFWSITWYQNRRKK